MAKSSGKVGAKQRSVSGGAVEFSVSCFVSVGPAGSVVTLSGRFFFESARHFSRSSFIRTECVQAGYRKMCVAGMKLDLPVDIGGRFLYRTGLKCLAAAIN